ncbi:hypothetical protein DFH11DRAFT_1728654 [Phellopilus nigrolimitatus]|nr:hypothetical protein DFH11DRAFT_1728654 [Phellopilus nigrolimitatus]
MPQSISPITSALGSMYSAPVHLSADAFPAVDATFVNTSPSLRVGSISVFAISAAVLARARDIVEVACYNPHIFLFLGDLSVSVWKMKSTRPFVAANDVFACPIMDLAWATDGLAFYAVSYNSTLTVFASNPPELEGIVLAERAATTSLWTSCTARTVAPAADNFARAKPDAKEWLWPCSSLPTGPSERATSLVTRRVPKDRRRTHRTFFDSLCAN